MPNRDTRIAEPSSRALRENEGLLLSLLARSGPLTAYQIFKAYGLSPVSTVSSSKGKIYPIIRRLVALELVVAEAVEDDARGTELLTCTKAGRKWVKQWVKELRPAHILPDDGLRARILSFGLLSAGERAKWVSMAHTQLLAKLEELERYKEETETPFQELAHQNAVMTTQARMSWLDRVFRELANQSED